MVDILVIADSLRKRGLKGFAWVISIFKSRGLMEIERHIQGFSADYDGTRKSFGDLAWTCQGTFFDNNFQGTILNWSELAFKMTFLFTSHACLQVIDNFWRFSLQGSHV